MQLTRKERNVVNHDALMLPTAPLLLSIGTCLGIVRGMLLHAHLLVQQNNLAFQKLCKVTIVQNVLKGIEASRTLKPLEG